MNADNFDLRLLILLREMYCITFYTKHSVPFAFSSFC